MAGNWFFLSYARHDRDEDPFECIRKFYTDLNREIRLQKNVREDDAGFYDGTGIQQGNQWPATLGTALNGCRTLICMYSPSYFDSEYCGKELSVFNGRVDAFMNNAPQGTSRPNFILPVLLYPPDQLGAIPQVLAGTQYFDDAYPELYKNEGLRYFFRRNGNDLKDAYQDFLDTLVKKLLAAATNGPPSLPQVPDIKTIQSLFHAPPSVSPGGIVLNQEPLGPQYADFFYVAGKRDEIQPLGRSVDNYGVEGELDWQPYLPEAKDQVWLIAQGVATTEGFRYQRVALDNNLLTFIRDAEDKSRIVIIIVDAWTLQLEKYKRWMADYDRQNFGNSAVLIVRNDKDADTIRVRQSLDIAVRQTFLHKARMNDPNSFISNIGSRTDLTSMLSVALQKIRKQIIDTNELRRIVANELITKPEIIGPGG